MVALATRLDFRTSFSVRPYRVAIVELRSNGWVHRSSFTPEVEVANRDCT
jgi:hypothetical protein